ncbi:MAG: hypothetical protein Q9N32_02915 [Gammaproteobacteria bacterium]|nr:hypothetical protein [Gammaproteobacteria bacterium]
MKTLTILAASFVGLMSLNSVAATVDGSITYSEYQWNTEGVEGSAKWEHMVVVAMNITMKVVGDKYEIDFLGTNITDGKFQFGAIGGDILSGRQAAVSGVGNSRQGLFLSDFAISVNNASANPTTDSSAFGYAIRLLSVDDNSGLAQFELLGGGTWEAINIYEDTYAPKFKSETYKMGSDAVSITTFVGKWAANGGDDNVLEGEFDLSFLNLRSV